MIQLKNFGGLYLRYAKDRIPDNAAQNCFDVDFSEGSLIGLPANTNAETFSYPVRGALIHSSTTGVDTRYVRNYDINAVRSPVIQDDHDRIYWTGIQPGGATEFRYALRRENTAPYITQSYKVGVINSSIWDNTLASLGISFVVRSGEPPVNFGTLANSVGQMWVADANGNLINNVSDQVSPAFAGVGDVINGWHKKYTVTLSKGLSALSQVTVPSGDVYDKRVGSVSFSFLGGDRNATFWLQNGVIKYVVFDTSLDSHLEFRTEEPLVPGSEVVIRYVLDESGSARNLSLKYVNGFTLSVDGTPLPPTITVSPSTYQGEYQFAFVWEFTLDGQRHRAVWFADSSLSNTLPIGLGVTGTLVKVTDTLYEINAVFGSDSTALEARAYAMTLVNQLGEESEMSLPVEVSLKPGSERVSIVVDDEVFGNALANTHLFSDRYPLHGGRVYRSVGGSFFYVGTISAADQPDLSANGERYLEHVTNVGWVDDVTDAALGDACSTTDYISDASELQKLRGLTTVYNGILAAFKDNEVWLCEPYKPWAWRRANVISLPHKVVSIATHEQGILVLTELRTCYMSGQVPSDFVPTWLPGEYPCVHKNGVLSLDDKTVFASTDGPVIVKGLSQTLEQVVVTRDEWRKKMASLALRLAQYGSRILAYWATNQTDEETGKSCGGMLFDQNSGNWTYISDVPMYAHHVPANSFGVTHDALVFADSTNTLKTFSSSTSARKNWHWHSKDFLLPRQTNFGVVQLFGTGSVRVRIVADGAQVYDQTLAASLAGEIHRLPGGHRAVRWSFKFDSITPGAELRAVNFAHNMQELRNVV